MRWMADQAKRSRLAERFRSRTGRDVIRAGEISPAMVAPVLATSRAGEKTGFPMQWGYRMDGKRTVVNARTETAAGSGLFGPSWEKHRCAVPAAWYYEWEHTLLPDGKKETGRKFSFRPAGGGITWLCGLYRMEDGLPRFVILTREPSAEIAAIHDRMPLVIAEQDVAEWIHPDGNAEVIARRALTEMTMQQAG